jgi:GNAT superfamily N-acetyltransferase
MSEPAEPVTTERDGYIVSTDPARLDLDAIHAFLSTESHWALGIPRDVVARSIAHSVVAGVYAPDGAQVGFARVVTDRATFAYLCDVYVLEAHRGRGLSTWLTETLLTLPELQGLRRWLLATKTAHGLYEKFGFAVPQWANAYMHVVDPDIYGRPGRPRNARLTPPPRQV